MVLSSNWLQLQSSQTASESGKENEKRLPKTKKSPAATTDKHAGKGHKPVKVGKTLSKINKKDFGTKGGKKNIMTMVHSMTHEMELLEGQKTRNSAVLNAHSVDDLEKTLQTAVGDRGPSRALEVGKYVSLDCEFVGVGPGGADSALARATLVNYFGHVVLDIFVKPQEKVTDWRTWVSGVRPQDMQHAVVFSEAQERVAKTLENRILVGHSVAHDLQALFLSHPRTMIRDTSRHLPFRRKYAGGKTPSLKKLSKEILGLEIQGSEHSPIEDARATMLIYKSDRKEFERLHQIKFGSGGKHLK
ncbi:LADA_0F05578g1_1 [Lachancea dasiensis]|uniref:RNA exonuclease 4 n=1 Tax=Lachancea dasiensis TaxID=1072105 RepID=A0A1G4JJI8_9SACH|nr:LADA_0F05578g1_1 [Lachancea dasiensis]